MRKTHKQRDKQRGGGLFTTLKLKTMSKNTKIINLNRKNLSISPNFEKFKKLIKLEISNNNISVLDYLPNTLEYLNCSNNQLNTLPTLPLHLLTLNCSDNPLHSLPTLPSNLSTLECKNCPSLIFLPKLPSTLWAINCNGCSSLTSLTILPPTLEQLNCSECLLLRSLPDLPPKLERLDCSECPLLTFIPDTPPTLQYFDCSECPKLTSLPVPIFKRPKYFYYNHNIPFRNKHNEKIELVTFSNINEKCDLNKDGEEKIVNHTTLDAFNETDEIYKLKDGHCYDWKTIKRGLTPEYQFKSHFTNEMIDLNTGYNLNTTQMTPRTARNLLSLDDIGLDLEGGRNKTKKNKKKI